MNTLLHISFMKPREFEINQVYEKTVEKRENEKLLILIIGVRVLLK